MSSGENPVWLPEYGLINIVDFAGEFPPSDQSAFYSTFGGVPEVSVEMNGSFEDQDCNWESCSQKRFKVDTSSLCGSKASREKMRRDKLNDWFMELSSLLNPTKKPRTDKALILSDAIRIVNQLRSESKKLTEENVQLEEIIKELRAEKTELREEKVKLKADKERLEHQMKAMTTPMGGFLPHPTSLHAPLMSPPIQLSGTNKPVPFMSYGGIPLWQFLPPEFVDSSKDPTGISPGA